MSTRQLEAQLQKHLKHELVLHRFYFPFFLDGYPTLIFRSPALLYINRILHQIMARITAGAILGATVVTVAAGSIGYALYFECVEDPAALTLSIRIFS